MAVLALTLTAGAGCAPATGSPSAGPAASSPAASSPATGSSAASPAASPGTPSPAASPVLPSWPDTARTADGSGAPGTLTGIAVGEHPTFDRLVFDFSGGIPGYDVRYVQQLLADGSGQPVTLAGQAVLRIVFHPVTLQQAYSGPSVITPGYPALRQVKSAGGFEGYLTFGAGLAHVTGFTVFTLTGPDRVVIDVAHG